jgi:hypothetical protein
MRQISERYVANDREVINFFPYPCLGTESSFKLELGQASPPVFSHPILLCDCSFGPVREDHRSLRPLSGTSLIFQAAVASQTRAFNRRGEAQVGLHVRECPFKEG